jgi:hypothetical protein
MLFTMSSLRHSRIRRLVTRLEDFSRFGIGIPLRPYQQEVADAVVRSILARLGLSFVVIFPRQSGKNETQAHIEAYLLCLLSGQDIEIVSVSPTYKPQALNAMLRLQRCLDSNPFTCGRWHTQAGFTVRLDRACVHFFSGNSVAHTVGATASALLSVDEAAEKMDGLLKPIDVSEELKQLRESQPQYTAATQGNNQNERKSG